MKSKSVQTTAVLFVICALALTACGSKSSSSSTAAASSSGSTTTAAASSSKASSTCISAFAVESALLLEVKPPTSSTSGDTTTCNYAPTTSNLADGPVTITYTANATAATLAAAKAKATSDGFTNIVDSSGIGDGGFTGSKPASGTDVTQIDGVLGKGTLEVITSFSGSAEQQAYLEKLYGAAAVNLPTN